MTLAMFALAYLAVLRARLQTQPSPVLSSQIATEVAKEGHISSQST